MGKLVVDSLKVSLGKKEKKEILHSLSFALPSSSISVVMGASGSGKTTLLRSILGLLPYEGKISLDGVDLMNVSTKERNFSYVNQDIGLYPHLTIFQNIAFPLKGSFASGEEIRRRVEEAAKRLDIEECLSRRPRDISLGQCQRAAVAKAILKRSELYLLDEPFANLDEPRRYQVALDVKRVLHSEGASVIYVTHSLREAYLVGDYFLALEDGKLGFQGDVNSFRGYVDRLGWREE